MPTSNGLQFNALIFLILSINLIIIILYFSLSQAKITLVLAREELARTIEIPVL